MIERSNASWILAIDDSPGRYDEFSRLLDRERSDLGLVIACQPDIVRHLLASGRVAAILLDRDMPHLYGEVWAQEIAEGCRLPTVVVSTTADTKARELMFRLLSMAGVQVTNCFADHQGCETEWLWWLRGVTGIR